MVGPAGEKLTREKIGREKVSSLPPQSPLFFSPHVSFCARRVRFKVSVKENEVPTGKNSNRASIFAAKASYISN